jgi:hypothetical protein
MILYTITQLLQSTLMMELMHLSDYDGIYGGFTCIEGILFNVKVPPVELVGYL